MNHREQALEELASHGIINIFGDIRRDATEHIFYALAIAEASTLTGGGLDVRIHSSGGNVAEGLALYDMIRACPRPAARGIVTGRCDSIAAVVLQACEERVMLRHATMLVHYITRTTVPLNVLRDPMKLSELIAELERDQGRINVILAARSKRTVEEIERRYDLDKPMTAEEAVEFGLADRIIDGLDDLDAN